MAPYPQLLSIAALQPSEKPFRRTVNSPMASAPAAVQLTREEQHVSVAKKMFFAGLAFLPWLWALNVIYFRSSLFSNQAHPELKKCP